MKSRIYRIAWEFRSRNIISRPTFERVCRWLDNERGK